MSGLLLEEGSNNILRNQPMSFLVSARKCDEAANFRDNKYNGWHISKGRMLWILMGVGNFVFVPQANPSA